MLFQSRGENRETKIFQRPAPHRFGRFCGGPFLKNYYMDEPLDLHIMLYGRIVRLSYAIAKTTQTSAEKCNNANDSNCIDGINASPSNVHTSGH